MCVPMNQTELKRHLHYNPLTGNFTRNIADSNGQRPGQFAGGVPGHSEPVLRVGSDSHRYRKSHLAFLYMDGKWPVGKVRHLDGDHTNYRWINLIDTGKEKETNHE